jgi:MFS family permease
MLLLGLGNAAAQLSRYIAADLYPEARRGFAISLVVWAGAVGAVGGPLLLSASASAATAAGWPGYCGPFLLAAVSGAAALLAALAAPAHTARSSRSRVPMRLLLRAPAVRSAVAIMVTAQVVMVAVMTAVPLDLHQHGHGLGGVGAVLSAHTLGMFALSPLTGWLLDHIDARAVMAAGLLGLAAATGLAVLTAKQTLTLRSASLFLLGYAWNLCFVGGSSHLAKKIPAKVAVSVEGAVDSVVWIAAAGASLCSTIVLLEAGYAVLAGIAGALVVLPAIALLAELPRRNLVTPPHG